MKIRSAFLTTLFLLIVSPLMAAGTYTYSDPTLSFIDGTEGTSANFEDAYLADVSGGWGVVNEVIPGAVYIISANIEFGDGSTPSWFTSLNQMIYFEDGFTFKVLSQATLQIGELSGDFGINGSLWSAGPSSNMDVVAFGDSAILQIYDTTWYGRTSSSWRVRGGDIFIRNSILKGNTNETSGVIFVLDSFVSSISINKLSLINMETFQINRSPILMEDVFVHTVRYGIQVNTAGSVIISGMTFSNVDIADVRTFSAGSVVIKDLVTPISSVQINTPGGNILNPFSVNIHINDKTGANLESATVTATSFGNIVSDDGGSTFYRCIVDHTAGTFATDVSAGKWELTTAANAALAGVTGAVQEGEWITAILYEDAEEVLSELTDANGDIAEQTLTFKKWIGTSVALLSFSPHTFTATKAREGTVEILNVTVDSPIDWTIQLSIGDRWPRRGMKRLGY